MLINVVVTGSQQLVLSFSLEGSTFGGRKKNAIFNDALTTFHYGYIGIEHMVKNHIDLETGNPLPPFFWLLFSIDSRGSFICLIP